MTINDPVPHNAPLHVGLIGDPVAHSLSPRFQQAAFDALGIAARYELWQTPSRQLPERIDALRAPGYLGANVTIPHKEAVLTLVDEIDPLAARIGAVNTIVCWDDSRLVGYNTDAPGLLRALLEQGIGQSVAQGAAQDVGGRGGKVISLAGYAVLLLGAGGAARGAAFALTMAGVEHLFIVNRRLERAELLARAVQQGYGGEVRCLDDAARVPSVPRMVIINATSVGLHGDADDASPVSEDVVARLAPDTFVYDMIYNPPETRLISLARARGLRAANGLSMLLHQGALSFTHWTGREAPLGAMWAALR